MPVGGSAPLIARLMVQHTTGGGGSGTGGTGGTGNGEGGPSVISAGMKAVKDIAQAFKGKENTPAAPQQLAFQGKGFEDMAQGINIGAAQTKENTVWTKSVADFMKVSIDQGKSGLSTAHDHLKKTMGVQFTMGSVLKQSQIFTGYLGSMFQLMGALVDVILAPFLPILIPAIQVVAKMIPIVSKMAKGMYEVLKNTVGKFLGGIYSLFPQWLKKGLTYALGVVILGAFFGKIFGLFKIFGALTKGSAKVTQMTLTRMYAKMSTPGSVYVRDLSIGKMMGGQGKLATKRGLRMGRLGMRTNLLLLGVTGIMSRGFGMFKSGLAGLKGLLGISSGNSTKLVRGQQVNAAASVSWWGKLLKNASDFKTNSLARLGALRTGIVERFKNLKGSLVESLSNVRTRISTALGDFKSSAIKKWDSIRNSASEKITNMKNSLKNTFDDMNTKVRGGLTDLKTKITGSFTDLKTNLGTKWTNMTTKFTNMKTSMVNSWDNLKTSWTSKFDDMKTKWTTKWGNVTSSMTEGWTNLKTSWTTKFDNFKTSWVSKVDDLKLGFLNKVDDAKAAITTVKTAITNLPTTLSGLFSGIKNAITNKVTDVVDKVKDVGKAVKDSKIGKGVSSFLSKAGDFVKGGPGKVANVIGKQGDKVNKFWGGLTKSLDNNLTKPLKNSKIGKTLTANLGKGTQFAKWAGRAGKALPVVGAGFEAIYGISKSVGDFKNYGAKAGFARLGLTAAATVGSFFDPTGVASAGLSIGGHYAMDKAFEKIYADKNKQPEEISIKINHENTQGLETITNYKRKKHNDTNPPIQVDAFATEY